MKPQKWAKKKVRGLLWFFLCALLLAADLVVASFLLVLVSNQPVLAREAVDLPLVTAATTALPRPTDETPTPTATPTVIRNPKLQIPDPTEVIVVSNPISASGWLPVVDRILPPCVSGEEFYLALGGSHFSAELTGEGKRTRHYHPGLDGACRKGRLGGWLATAVTDGRVAKVYKSLVAGVNTPENPSYDLWSSGHTVVMAFEYGGVRFEAIYGHLASTGWNEDWPREGDLVKSGQPLGRIGSTGSSSGLHLHLGLRYQGEDGNYHFVNPADYGVLATRP